MAFCRYKFGRLLYTNIQLVVWYDVFLSDFGDEVLSNGVLSLSSGFMTGGYLSRLFDNS